MPFVCERPLGTIHIGSGNTQGPRLPNIPLEIPVGYPKLVEGKSWASYQLLVEKLPTIHIDDQIAVTMSENVNSMGALLWRANVQSTTRTTVPQTPAMCVCSLNATYSAVIQSPLLLDLQPLAQPPQQHNCTCNHTTYMTPAKGMEMNLLPSTDMIVEYANDGSILKLGHNGPFITIRGGHLFPPLYNYPATDCYSEYDKPCRSGTGQNPFLLLDGGIPHNMDYIQIFHKQPGTKSLSPSIQVWVGNQTNGGKYSGPNTTMCNFLAVDPSKPLANPLRLDCAAKARFVWIVLPGWNRQLDIQQVKIHRPRFVAGDCQDYWVCSPLNQTLCGEVAGCVWDGATCQYSTNCLPPALCWGTVKWGPLNQKYYTPMEDGEPCWWGSGKCYGTVCTDTNGYQLLAPPNQPMKTNLTCDCQPGMAVSNGQFGPQCKLQSAAGLLGSFTIDVMDKEILTDDFGPAGYVIYTKPMVVSSIDGTWLCTQKISANQTNS
eukprot:TRINITY_DN385_c0_g1_i1.p1 TRINITY_DN385_c0_g1~~TRINITY_DN385_c0_g1_i1.p1  ORF type:complete len:526 (-),score=39.81 TRINITY_DN385_c0_g1_i1:83-1549(-)